MYTAQRWVLGTFDVPIYGYMGKVVLVVRNNDQDSRCDGSDQVKDSDDDKTQSDNENKSDSKHENNESVSESDQEEEEEKIEDDEEEEEEEEIVKTPQLYDDVDIRLNEPVDSDKGFVQEEGTNAAMTNKMEVLVTSSSHSSDLAAKFLNFANIPHLNAEIVSPLDVHVHHEVPIFQFNNLVTTLEKEVAELKKDDPLKTQVTALVDKHLDARLGATRDEFINFLSTSLSIRITDSNHRECYEGLKKSYDLDKTFFSTYGKVYSLKMSRKDKEKDKDKDPFAGSDRGLKKRKTRKDVESPKEEPEFEVTDSDMPHDQKENPNNDDEPKEKKNPKGGDYPFDPTKLLPLVKIGNRQKVPVDYFFNNDLKYLQGGISIMTYTTSLTKTKAAQYDLPGIKDIVPNICNPVKVAYDKHALWGISHWKEQRKTFYSYARGLPETTKSGIKKRDPYTTYQDPQGFIYFDDGGRNRLMHSDELYKFGDGTLTRLQTSLSDITKNIQMEYLTSGYFNEQYGFVILCLSS
nr:hypothetical protein [Tanacetum cinerariifolium]